MKIIIDYGWFWEVFEIKLASKKQMIEVRNKVVDSFTKKKDLIDLEIVIKNAKSIKDLFGNE